MEIIAELSSNHCGSIMNLMHMIKTAQECGCDTVKLQLYEPDEFSSGILINKYEEIRTPFSWIPAITEMCKLLDIKLITTVYSLYDLRECEEMGDFKTYKISSFENEDYELINAVLETGKDLIISTDMHPDIEKLVDVLGKDFKGTILKCCSSYPAPLQDMNLETLKTLRKIFPHARLGLSDHTTSSMAGLVSLGYGVKCIEKHYRADIPDAPEQFATDIDEMEDFVSDIQNGYATIGKSSFNCGNTQEYKKRVTPNGFLRKLKI